MREGGRASGGATSAAATAHLPSLSAAGLAGARMGAACSKTTPQADAADASAYSDEDNEPEFQPVRAERRVSEPQAAPATPSAAPRDAGGAAAAPLSPAWPEDAAPDALAAGNAGSALDVARAEPPVRLRWQRGELLGTGAFGRVYLGLNEETGELLAVKEVLLSGGTMAKATEQLRSLEAEVGLLRALSHPNIVRYIGTERTPEALHIFLEFVPGGSIAGLLSKFGPFAERVVAVYTRQILEGLAYLHRNQIMHRDIKGANILVDNTGVVKLADFGASRQLADLVTMESGFKSMKGTPYWMAPEVIKQTGHGRQADIWSVGCTALEMVTAKPPWGEYATQVSALFHIASAKGPPPLPAGLSPEALDFMLLCFNRVPKDRPNAVRLLQHPFVAAVGDVVRQSTAGGSASLASTPTAGVGFRRTVSTIPEGISPSPSTEAAASAPRFTPADPLSSMGTSASEKTSSPAESDEQAMESLRRRLPLDASADAEGPAPGGRSPDLPPAGASSALSPNSLDSVGGSPYNPMQEPSWSPGQSLADLRQSPAGSDGGNGQQPQPPPTPVAASLQSPGLPASPTPLGTPPSKIRVTPRRAAGDSPVARAVAALEKSTLEQAAKQEGSPVKGRSAALPPRPPAPPTAASPLSSNSPPLPPAEPRPSEADSLRVSDETIDSLLARAEQESVAAREAARMEMRRSKQAQWEAELQRELDAQREEKRGRRSGA